MDASQRVVVAERILDNLQTQLDNETAYCAANGPKPNYVLPTGENFDWLRYEEWLLNAIQKQQGIIQTLGGPWAIRSRART